jgi:hypothetical protein
LGEVIINPSFLMESNFTLKTDNEDTNKKDPQQKITQTFQKIKQALHSLATVYEDK